MKRIPVIETHTGYRFYCYKSAARFFKVSPELVSKLAQNSNLCIRGLSFDKLTDCDSLLRIDYPYGSPMEWKPIPGFEDLYMISNFGDIISIKHSSPKIKAITTTSNHQHITVLYKNNIPNPKIVEFIYHEVWCDSTPYASRGQTTRTRYKVRRVDTGEIFDSYKVCCKKYNMPYKEFAFAMKHKSCFWWNDIEFCKVTE